MRARSTNRSSQSDGRGVAVGVTGVMGVMVLGVMVIGVMVVVLGDGVRLRAVKAVAVVKLAVELAVELIEEAVLLLYGVELVAATVTKLLAMMVVVVVVMARIAKMNSTTFIVLWICMSVFASIKIKIEHQRC